MVFFFHVKRMPAYQLWARMGEHDQQSMEEPHPHIDIKIQRIVIHPEWNPEKSHDPKIYMKYDLALLKLETPVDFALHVIPICLPEDDNKLVGRLAWAKGFGYDKSPYKCKKLSCNLGERLFLIM